MGLRLFFVPHNFSTNNLIQRMNLFRIVQFAAKPWLRQKLSARQKIKHGGQVAAAHCLRSAMRNRVRVPLREQWNGLMPHPLGRTLGVYQ